MMAASPTTHAHCSRRRPSPPVSLGLIALPLLLSTLPSCLAFVAPRPTAAVRIRIRPSSSITSTLRRDMSVSMPDGSQPPQMTPEEDAAVQWDLLTKHHALGSWRGTWISHDYMGDVVDSTLASVDLDLDPSGTTVAQTHKIVTGAVESDCSTCFDSSDVKTMPIAQYQPGNVGRNRLASVGMVTGPSILRSGAMSTELILRHGDGRIRVVFQHAPVWEAGVEPGSCPPQGLKLFRTLVSREALRPGPPTPQSEEADPPKAGNPKFFRGVPPFHWHKKWAGTSWTWGPTTGDRGWSINEMEEADAWHGRPTGDGVDVWSMRLPGGVLVQCPRVVVGGQAGLCRLAWLPEPDGDDAMLLRIEASVLALEPIIDENDDNMMVGFYPPILGSLRCDVMKKVGELEGASKLKELMEIDAAAGDGDGEGSVRPRDESEAPPPSQTEAPPVSVVSKAIEKGGSSNEKGGDGGSDGGTGLDKEGGSNASNKKGSEGDSGLDAVRNALKL